MKFSTGFIAILAAVAAAAPQPVSANAENQLEKRDPPTAPIEFFNLRGCTAGGPCIFDKTGSVVYPKSSGGCYNISKKIRGSSDYVAIPFEFHDCAFYRQQGCDGVKDTINASGENQRELRTLLKNHVYSMRCYY